MTLILSHLNYDAGMMEAAQLARIDEMWDFDDPGESERRFRQLLREWENAGHSTDAIDILRTQIARACGLQRKFDEAHALLDEIAPVSGAVDHAGALPGRSSLLRVRYLLERGRVFNSFGDRARAQERFRAAFEAAGAAGLARFTIDAAHMLAIVADAPEAALRWNEEALCIAEQSTDPAARAWRGSLHNNLGWTHHERGDFERALRHFERALECRIEQQDPKPISIARWCIARCLRSLGQVESALSIQRELLLAAGEEPTPSAGFVHEELGECLLALGRGEEARPHFARAAAILSQDPWLAEREPRRLERIARLAGPQE